MSITASEDILIVDVTLTVNSTETSVNATTGAMVVTSGGVGMKNDLNIGNNLSSYSNFNQESTLTLGSGSSSYFFPTENGNGTEVLIFTTTNGLVFGSIEEPNQVTTLSFGTNNKLLKSLGTTKDIEATGIIVSDTDDMSDVNTLNITSSSTFSGSMKITSTTSSVSNTTGSLVVNGGVGIGENLNIGGNMNIDGTANLTDILTLGESGTDYYFPTEKGSDNQILIVSTNGALVFMDQMISSTQVQAPSTFGADNLMIKTQGTDRNVESTGVTVTDSDDITGLSTLSVDTTGNFGGIVNITNTAPSLSGTTGAVVVSGGVGITENLYIANNLNISGNLDVNNTFTIGMGSTSYDFPVEQGAENNILVVSTSGGLVFETPTSNPNAVEAPSPFGTDNVLIKTSGTSRDTEATGITLSDTDNLSGVNSINVNNNSTFGGTIGLTSGTSSIDTTTGTIVITGGTGISENLNIGGDLSSNGTFSINNTNTSNNSSSGALTVTGGVGIGGDINIGGTLTVDNLNLGNQDVQITSTTESIDNTTGALIVSGGLGLTGNLNMGGTLKVDSTTTFNGITTITDTTQSNDTTSGTFLVSGGVGISKNLNVGGTINVTDTTQSTDINSGALIVDGGVGIEKNLNIGGDYQNEGSVIIRDTTNSDGTNGALVVSGGMSIDKDLYVSGNLYVTEPVINDSKFFMGVHTATVQTSSTTFVELTWDTEIRKDTALYTHSANSADITILESGWYEIIAEITSQIESGDGTNRTISSTQITVNGSPIAASTSFIMNRTAQRGHGTTNVTTIHNMSANDIVNVEINRLLGTSTVTTVANACRIFISRI